MKKLVAVEYAPAPDKKEKWNDSPISGAVGETFNTYLAAENSALVPVRFPLVGPGSYRKLLTEERNPLDQVQFLSEAVLLPRKWIHKVNRTPLSLYTEVKGKAPGQLFEQPNYLRFVSRKKFLKAVEAMAEHFPKLFMWKKEWNPGLENVVFLEARIYGIDAVISTYDPKKLRGAAISVIVNPLPTPAHLAKNIKVQRCVSDTLLMSNLTEYVSYLDGVKIPREETKRVAIIKRYESTMTAREFCDSKKGSKVEPEKNQKDKQYYTMPENPAKGKVAGA